MGDSSTFEFAGTERFEVLSRLGSGGMGVVYEALDRELDARVALKTLSEPSPGTLYRLKNEFRALQDFDHPNLVSMGELFNEGGKWFFTMELIDGVDFVSYVQGKAGRAGAHTTGSGALPSRGPDETTRPDDPPPHMATPENPVPRTVESPPGFDESRLRDGLVQLAQGLEALHATDRVHRDIKPSNIMVTKEGRVVLLDFGLVTQSEPGVLPSADQVPIGTVAYMSPEQAASQVVGPETDWYAVGVVLYQILTGRLPFVGPALAVLLAKQQQEPARPREMAPDVPEDLDALCLSLLRFEPSQRPSGARVLRRLQQKTISEPQRSITATTRTTYFVGRKKELDVLFHAFDALKQRRPASVLVHGASGLGKSELLRTFARQLSSRHSSAVILSGRCYERESVPFKAFDNIVDSLSRLLRRLPAKQASSVVPRYVSLLIQVFPVLGRVEQLRETPLQHRVDDLQERRTLAFKALRELLVRLADLQRVVLIIDDLQWAGEDSLKLLRTLLQPPDAPVICLLAALRTPLEEEQARQAVQAATSALPEDLQTIEVGPLSAQESSALADKLLGEDPTEELDSEARQARTELISRESAGHPLFIQQLVYRVLEKSDPAEALRLDEVLFERVSALEANERGLVELVSVAGGPIQQETAAETTGLGPAELIRLVARLKVMNLLRSRGMRMNDTIEPYHDRVREAVVERLSPEQRQAWHRKLAVTLRASGQAESELLARHFEGAGELELAASYAARAAAQATEILAFDRAASLYRQALELRRSTADEGGHDEERRGLLIHLGEALANAGRGAEAADAYQRAVAGAKAAEALDLEQRAVEQLFRSGHMDQGLLVAERVLSAQGMRLPKTPFGALCSLLWRRLQIRLRGVGFKERDESQVSGEDLVRVDSCRSVALGLGTTDHIRGADFSTRYVLNALKSGESGRVLHALVVETGFIAASGRPESRYFTKLVTTAETLLSKIDDPTARAHLEADKAFGAFAAGAWMEAKDHAERAQRFLKHGGTSWELAYVRFYTLWSLFRLGELKEMSSRLFLLVQEALDRGDLFAAAGMILGLTNVAYLNQQGPEQARMRVVEIMQRWSVKGYHIQHYYALLANTHIDLYQWEGLQALQRLGKEWPQLRRSLLLQIPAVHNEALYLRGRAALAAARAADSSERRYFLSLAQKDARRLTRRKLAWTSALAHLLRAGVAAQRGEDEIAITELETAIDALEAADMRLYAAVARRRLGVLIGGDDGAAHLAAGNEFMEEQDVREPERMTDMLAPGFRN